MYSLMYLAIVVLNETLATVATEEGELLVVLPLMSVPVAFKVESLPTN